MMFGGNNDISTVSRTRKFGTSSSATIRFTYGHFSCTVHIDSNTDLDLWSFLSFTFSPLDKLIPFQNERVATPLLYRIVVVTRSSFCLVLTVGSLRFYWSNPIVAVKDVQAVGEKKGYQRAHISMQSTNSTNFSSVNSLNQIGFFVGTK